MRAHEANGQAVALARFDRHRMFVRYDNTWWVARRDSFIEINRADQTAKLDRWHRRVTQGALWD
ncbi:hypothetical protein QLQ12_39425 [Actinoplanes sp. NEAU-A12]|uniref:WYL domain-containing protein n=1 Tax=Actinoplanes sandaracinus TaxID=3045177 RepID=A0ABT6WY56_9ACTN|nr:hypothetical protein [Actinoplanes sandaracinus]MDI6104680.1 hypothetical protein [Actinoplanes sandaracinus]